MITALIQMTQRRRALTLLELGPELDLEVVVWQKAIGHIPDNYLDRSYDHAAENWDWHDSRRPFTPDAVAASYSILVVEDRQRREAAQRNAVRSDREASECPYCCNTGYQAVFIRVKDQWQQTARPCSCDLAPMGVRSDVAFSEPEYVRDRLGRYARRDLIHLYGLPAISFQQFTPVPSSSFNPEEELSQEEIELLKSQGFL